MLIAIVVLIIIGIMASSEDFRDFVWVAIVGFFTLAAWLLTMLFKGLVVVVPIALTAWLIFYLFALFLG